MARRRSAHADAPASAGNSDDLFEFGGGRKKRAVFGDEPAERRAVAFATNPAREEREVDVASGFIPSAKGAGGHVLFHALGGAA